MLFNSLTFIVFFAFVLILHNLPFSWKLKKSNLILASYIFYAAWNPLLIILLWLSTVVDWFVGKALYKTEGDRNRRLMLAVSLIVNLGMLGSFKYAGFMLDNFVAVMKAYGMDFNPAKPTIILPMGISFYTFQTLTYTFDIYRRELKPAKSFLDYALYVTFFPQLVAGPIVRATEFLPQLRKQPRITSDQFLWGLTLLTLGLFQKVVLADGLLAEPADKVFGSGNSLNALDAWAGVLAFSSQIFCDFAGYSTCAIGAALTLGFHLPTNFRAPYAAIGFSDFWRRWHITLSSWLRDYLYIPLGGNQKGRIRTDVNLMVTMLLGGLWHGASWTFVVWGGIHGIYLVVEKFLRQKFPNLRWTKSLGGKIFLVLLTYFLVNITWVFFRASDFPNAVLILRGLFGFVEEGIKVLSTLELLQVAIVTGGLVGAHWLLRHTTHEELVRKTPWPVAALVWAGMLILIILMQGGGNAFIYFQF